jgi:hypothetical protein
MNGMAGGALMGTAGVNGSTDPTLSLQSTKNKVFEMPMQNPSMSTKNQNY